MSKPLLFGSLYGLRVAEAHAALLYCAVLVVISIGCTLLMFVLFDDRHVAFLCRPCKQLRGRSKNHESHTSFL